MVHEEAHAARTAWASLVKGLEAEAENRAAQRVVVAGLAGQRREDFHRDGVELALAVKHAVEDVVGPTGEHVHQELGAAQQLGHALHGELAVDVDVSGEFVGGEQQGLLGGLIKGNGHWRGDIKSPRCSCSEGFGERN